MANRTILVTGATGQQGSATLTALSAQTSPNVKILAVTRDPSSAKSKALQASFPDVTLVQGSPTEPSHIFSAHPEISSVFVVTVPPNEESQAKPIIDASISHGVEHIVFSSVDRGGDEDSWDNETTVPHFAQKCRIESYLRNACLKKDVVTRWTILRPAGFMDNYKPGTSFARMMATLWSTMPGDRKMQLVSTNDIGVFAARTLLEGPATWGEKAIGLAGDDLSFDEAKAAYRRVLGQDMAHMWSVVGSGIRWAVEDAGTSMKWFEDEGFAVDIQQLRGIFPEIQTFEMWLATQKDAKDLPT
jgi:uncharacterized protein YbjT (DUF2867 family)